MKFVKILQENEKHHNFTYQEGYNTELNFDSEIDCNKGLHFCEKEYIKNWFNLGKFDGHYREVITFVNCIEDKYNNKYKAKTIFIGPKQEFTEEMYIKAVKKDGWSIEFIKNPSEEMKIEAVKQTGYVIQYIKDPSEQVCIEAVKRCGSSIQFIKNPSEQVCIEAVKDYGFSIEYIENPSEQVCLEAIKQNGWCIEHIKNPTEEMKLKSFRYINSYHRYPINK